MRTLQNKKGFTIIEIMISVVLIGMVMMILMSMERIISREKTRVGNRAEGNTDKLLGERVLYLNLRGVTSSFNSVNLKDDHGNLFFDYYFDIPESLLAKGRTDRLLTLESGKERYFYMLSYDSEAGGMLDFDPVAAYKVGPIPADYNVAAELTFISVNNNNWIASQRPLFWQKDQLLFFDTNVYVRSSTNLDLSEAPTRPSFLGAVDALGNQVVGTGLADYLKANYRNVDTFLRELQPRGGGMPFVKVRPVKFYRYYLQPYRDDRVAGTPSRLMRDEYIGGEFKNQHMLSDRVKTVKFIRESVMNKVVQFSIEKVNVKRGL